MTLVLACLGAVEARQTSFYRCGVPAKLVQDSLRAWKDRESSFHHSGGHLKHVNACLSDREARESSFYHCRLHVNLIFSLYHLGDSVKLFCAWLNKCQERSRMQFPPLQKSCDARTGWV